MDSDTDSKIRWEVDGVRSEMRGELDALRRELRAFQSELHFADDRIRQLEVQVERLTNHIKTGQAL